MVSQGSRGPDLDDTIVALSSSAGPGLRAVIRLSGRDAFRITRIASGGSWEIDPLVRRQIISTTLTLPGFKSGLPTDIFLLRGPTTYTGQDVVELHTISSMPLVELVIARLLDHGGRAALPGEFTMRAFLAGKLDLTRAEAVHAVIEAETPGQLRTALTQLAGGLARPLDVLRDDLLNLLADVEAGLDFADEDISFVATEELLRRLGKALAQVTLVAKQTDQRSVAAKGFRVVLAGPPNAGKSSLFNALAGRDAALVSPQPGTTRDYLEAQFRIGDSIVHLIDTAGLGLPTGPLDHEAQSLGQDRIADADLVLWCHEGGVDDGPLAPVVNSGRHLCIATKSDLGPPKSDGMPVSVATGAGLDDLRNAIRSQAESHAERMLALSLSRCRHHVARCLDHLRHAHGLVLERHPAELLALELRLALDELGAIVGAVYTNDLLDRVFSRFCIGK